MKCYGPHTKLSLLRDSSEYFTNLGQDPANDDLIDIRWAVLTVDIKDLLGYDFNYNDSVINVAEIEICCNLIRFLMFEMPTSLKRILKKDGKKRSLIYHLLDILKF